jgi:hypothetical protein
VRSHLRLVVPESFGKDSIEMSYVLLFFAGFTPGVALLLVAWRMRAAEPGGQHAGAGEGALTVSHLLDQAEQERIKAKRPGRHALRDDTAEIPATVQVSA